MRKTTLSAAVVAALSAHAAISSSDFKFDEIYAIDSNNKQQNKQKRLLQKRQLNKLHNINPRKFNTR